MAAFDGEWANSGGENPRKLPPRPPSQSQIPSMSSRVVKSPSVVTAVCELIFFPVRHRAAIRAWQVRIPGTTVAIEGRLSLPFTKRLLLRKRSPLEQAETRVPETVSVCPARWHVSFREQRV